MNVGSLFSGIGGIDLGLERAGFRASWFCESDEFKRNILHRHWPTRTVYRDVRDMGTGIPAVDVITAGFPCVDLSIAGRRSGLAGAKSGLWSEVARIVRLVRPRFLLVENVADLLALGLGRVLSDLAASGYDAEWECFPAAAFGAPHLRARIWLLAYPCGFGDGLPEKTVFAGWARDFHSPWWDTEPGVPRVADGVPNGVDRRRALGDSVVTPIAEFIGRRILAAA